MFKKILGSSLLMLGLVGVLPPAVASKEAKVAHPVVVVNLNLSKFPKMQPRHIVTRQPIALRRAAAFVPLPKIVQPPVDPPVTTTIPVVHPPPLGGVWLELRMCESTDNYQINTGNGFYGAYQFVLSTWQSLGFPGYPNDAPYWMQDEAAVRDQAVSGWGQRPACSARLGL